MASVGGLREEVAEGAVGGRRVNGALDGELAVPHNVSVKVRSVADLELDKRCPADGDSPLLLTWIELEGRAVCAKNSTKSLRLNFSPYFSKAAGHVDVERGRLARGRGS